MTSRILIVSDGPMKGREVIAEENDTKVLFPAQGENSLEFHVYRIEGNTAYFVETESATPKDA